MTPGFEARIDPIRNLAHTRFAGEMTADALRAAAVEVEARLPELKSGFTVLADFSDLTAMELDGVPHLTRIMDLCRAHGVGMIIRVLPKPSVDIGVNILAVVHYRGKVKTVTVETMAEAERALGN